MTTDRARRCVVVTVAVALVGFLSWYLAVRNVSAYDAQPGATDVAYRALASAALVAPGLVLSVSAYRARDWSQAGWRLGVLPAWFFAALVLSFILGI